jgi:arylformamidase
MDLTPNHEEWIDLSIPLSTGMIAWPGDPAVEIRRALDMDEGADANVSHLDLGAHTGTHMDGPLHFLPDGVGLDAMPLEAVIGPARVIEIRDRRAVTAAELESRDLAPGERVLLKTRNSATEWYREPFREDFVAVAPDAARYLVERGVRTVGIAYLSVGAPGRAGVETHRILLEAGVWIIEGLALMAVAAGRYDLVCLPLRIARSDGAPCRAVLRRRT